MKRHSSAASLALAALVLLGLAGPAAAGEQVPFKGRLEGVVVTQTLLAPPFISVLVEGTGNATHLGRFTFARPHLGNLATGSLTGSYHFIAANGDELVADFIGQATVVGPGLLSVVETATITGGTGRFAGATGEFTVERLVGPVPGATFGSFNGTISPGAAKKQ